MGSSQPPPIDWDALKEWAVGPQKQESLPNQVLAAKNKEIERLDEEIANLKNELLNSPRTDTDSHSWETDEKGFLKEVARQDKIIDENIKSIGDLVLENNGLNDDLAVLREENERLRRSNADRQNELTRQDRILNIIEDELAER